MIVITYLTTKGPVSNGGAVFTPNSTLEITAGGSDQEFNVSTSTSTESSGGAFKEDLESIRQNASILFASQQRLVSAEDYTAQILSKYGSYFDDVIAWGGQDHDPPQFGKVYVGLNFKSGTNDDTKNTIKGLISDVLSDNLSVMSVDPIFQDPIVTNLELTVYFNFDPDLTGSTITSIENTIRGTIQNYFSTNLGSFNKVFRRSLLLAEIDDLDTSILNSRMDVKMQTNFIPTVNIEDGLKRFFTWTNLNYKKEI